ncbi:MAG TPA: acyl-ACP thioesterase domain-containing protein [Streptosporangiaceae bacterium]|nr:acyl-ACP thioesterase domain-containing protein [Streptosporangiaceae bacterium]
MDTPRPAATAQFRPAPTAGRVFTAGYPIRLTDVTPSGRLRLDALARYLQDVAEDDVADSGLSEPCDWLVRRCALSIRGYPRRGQRLRLATFCSATGPRWAERTTTVTAGGADLIQARMVWVAVDPATGESCQVGPDFHRLYGRAAQGRRVSVRLSHPRPGPTATGRDWPARASDFDTAGHVSNTVHWQAAEEVLAGLDWLPARAEMEYHHPILPGARLRLACQLSAGRADLWLLNDHARLASAQLSR